MGPKTFISCYVCLKDFGSRSIKFHEPQCSERWRSSNKSLPIDERPLTPVKHTSWRDFKHWVCFHCQTSVPVAKRSEHLSSCFTQKSEQVSSRIEKKIGHVSTNIAKKFKSIDNSCEMTGVVKTDFSPRKGKENKNISNHIPIPSVGKKNAKNDEKSESIMEEVQIGNDAKNPENDHKDEETSSTSKRSVRPQTKILRRPTPNLKHPVIQMDSDDSSGDSSCSDKSKEDNPKRLKMGIESSVDSAHKPKNFIIYNKYNVERNTKNAPKERASASIVPTIPNPCNSCNRSMAPERLHSHAKKDSRGLMYRKSPSLDVKISSPQQKVPEAPDKSHTLMDVKMTSPLQKVPETLDKSPTLDVKMTSPRKKIVEPSHKPSTMDVKITSPQQKLNKLIIKSPSLDLKTIPHRKLPESSSNKLSSETKTPLQHKVMDKLSAADSKATQKLSETSDKSQLLGLNSPSVDVKDTSSSHKTSETLDKSQLLDVKMNSPQKKVSRTPPYKNKVLNKISKHAQGPQFVKDCSNVSPNECPLDTKDESLLVPGDSVPTTKEELVDSEKACYICLKEFKVSALLLHESKCLETWKKENNSLNPNLRKLPPRRPEEEDDDEEVHPDEADPAWTSVQSQLVPCQLCSRTFFPERLPVHRRVCKGKPSPRPLKRAASLREQSASSTDGEDQKPAAAIYVPCYVCGRSYGSWVISMHEQQCLRRWRRENEKLPNDEQQEEPKKFPDFSPDDDVASLVELGGNAWESHLQQLVPCPLCARTFFPDRLGVHKRSCKGPPTSTARRPRSNKGA